MRSLKSLFLQRVSLFFRAYLGKQLPPALKWRWLLGAGQVKDLDGANATQETRGVEAESVTRTRIRTYERIIDQLNPPGIWEGIIVVHERPIHIGPVVAPISPPKPVVSVLIEEEIVIRRSPAPPPEQVVSDLAEEETVTPPIIPPESAILDLVEEEIVPSRLNASNFVNSLHYDLWCVGAGIASQVRIPPHIQALYGDLSNFTLPGMLCAKTNVESGIIGQSELQDGIKKWSDNHRTELTSDDPLQLSAVWTHLCAIHRDIVTLSEFEGNGREAEQRHPVDSLVKLAFSARTGCTFVTRLECTVRLRHSKAKVLPSSTAKADVLVITQDRRSIIEESMQWFTLDQRKVLRPNMVHISSVHDKYDLLSLIIFAGEYKRLYSEADMGRKQLIYVLSTAQSQRRALGLPRRTIFGFVSVQSSVEVYGSWWNRNKTRFTRFSSFNLVDPVDFLNFFTFLCKLNTHCGEIQRELDFLEAGYVEKSLKNNRWRVDGTTEKYRSMRETMRKRRLTMTTFRK